MNDSFELRFAQLDLSENSNCANIFKNSRYNGWYKICLETKEEAESYTDTIVFFRMPSSFKLYKDVIRNFTQEERKAGILRMLIGKDLQEEVKEIIKKSGKNDISGYLDSLSKEEMKVILNRMKKIVVFDCNKIPYLHIRTKSSETKNYDKTVKKHMEKYPNFLKIFHDVLNEKISTKKAAKESGNIIYNEIEG